MLPLWRAQRRPPAYHQNPLLVRVVGVVRPEAVARLELVHASANQLGSEGRAGPCTLAPPPGPIQGALPLVTVEVEDLRHGRSLPRRGHFGRGAALSR